uniref:Tick transposon n=1 Tax=Haemonchus placei TaxID=6290 RepID=A0A0N4X2R7_HAEPC
LFSAHDFHPPLLLDSKTHHERLVRRRLKSVNALLSGARVRRSNHRIFWDSWLFSFNYEPVFPYATLVWHSPWRYIHYRSKIHHEVVIWIKSLVKRVAEMKLCIGCSTRRRARTQNSADVDAVLNIASF